ncbi:ATP-binding cassette domain-containing protein [Aliivibrio kagoshimensis]|uniref:ATP-binding cassette domain-containing protein n=1 Tax=Aliivibrio kagoshimensis TaxID=2910230 RepID=UPI003D0EC663
MKITQLHLSSELVELTLKDWYLPRDQHWAVFGHNGSGKSLLGAWLAGEIEAVNAQVENRPSRVALVSLARQQNMLEEALACDESDFMDTQDFGFTVRDYLQQITTDTLSIEQAIEDCDLHHLLNQPFRLLSTGESRRLILAMALLEQPELLILDEPFAGLDFAHQKQLHQLLDRVSTQSQLLLICSRDEELPTPVQHIALLDETGLAATMSKTQWLEHPERERQNRLAEQQATQIVDELSKVSDATITAVDSTVPRFKIRSGRVSYSGETIFSGLNWQIDADQHWQIRGPNGCGKSTLLNMIFGDHPQCYSNDIHVFGHQRGTGESIWQIKQNMGMVSSALHLQYRVNCTALEVVISGLYDSIGIYQQPTKKEVEKAKLWLQLFAMGELATIGFKNLSYGQQRLLLIARALIKRPKLLLLDEPCQGLDFIQRQTVLQAMELIAKHNLSQLVYVTHHQEDALPSVKNGLDFLGQEFVVKTL